MSRRQGIVLGGRWLGAHAQGNRSVHSCDSLSILPAHCEVDCSVQPWSPFHRKPTSLRLWAKINSFYELFISGSLVTVTKVNNAIFFCLSNFVLSITTIISSIRNVVLKTLSQCQSDSQDCRFRERFQIQVGLQNTTEFIPESYGSLHGILTSLIINQLNNQFIELYLIKFIENCLKFFKEYV